MYKINLHQTEVLMGAVLEDSVDSELPPARSFLDNLLFQFHESRTFMGEQSPKIDHRKLVKAGNCEVSLSKIIPAL